MHNIPAEFEAANLLNIQRIQAEQIAEFDFLEPALICGVPIFHRLEPSRVVEQLLEDFGDCQVPLCDGTTCKLDDWYNSANRGYIKDWHINETAFLKSRNPVFSTPPFFRDWLSEFHSKYPNIGKLDFMFLYWGDKGTFTGYHEDVVGTFSWSLNIRGSKKWRFYVESLAGPVVIETIQCPGEMVFVPSGCYHTVLNLENDTISINQNWFNERNIDQVVKKVVSDYKKLSDDLDGFGVSFPTEYERIKQLDLLVENNNCLNIPILMDIFGFVRENSVFTGFSTERRIKASLEVMKDFLLKSDKTLGVPSQRNSSNG